MNVIQFEDIAFEILNTTLLEWIAVVSSLLYVILIAQKNISGWFFAAISSSVYIYLCFVNNYYLETILQVFYLAMAVWGWAHWNNTRKSDFKIQTWSLKHHAINIGLSTVFTLFLGYFFALRTDQALPYLDAFTTVFSIGATFMVARKVLENWIYWVVIDLVSIKLYSFRDLNLTAFLFAFYTVISIVSFVKWTRSYKKQMG